MLFIAILETQEAFIGIMMRQPNVRMKLLMREKPLEVETKGWGDTAIRVTFANL
jgi:hypothetical protein